MASFAASQNVDPEIAWAKLGALAEGARRATGQLWPRRNARVGSAPLG